MGERSDLALRRRATGGQPSGGQPSGFVQRGDGAILPLNQDFSPLQCGRGAGKAHGVLSQRGSLAGNWGSWNTAVRPRSVWLQDTHHFLSPWRRNKKREIFSSFFSQNSMMSRKQIVVSLVDLKRILHIQFRIFHLLNVSNHLWHKRITLPVICCI